MKYLSNQKYLFIIIILGSLMAAVIFREQMNRVTDEAEYLALCRDAGGFALTFDEKHKVCLHPSAVIRVERNE